MRLQNQVGDFMRPALLIFFALTFAAFAAEDPEDFPGPFPSWLDAKRDFGAVGDGQSDDSPALQKALDEIREHKRASVLFIPAGTYRLTQPLTTKRKGHTDNM